MKTAGFRLVTAGCFLGATAIFAPPALAQDPGVRPGDLVASVTYDPYARLGFGVADISADNGYRRPPGFDPDPEIDFDLSGDNVGFGEAAVGFDWQNGFRADLSLLFTGEIDISGECAGASNGTPCEFDAGIPGSGHADIMDASLSSTVLMGNLLYSPFEAQGSNSVFRPFAVGGLGLASNKVGEWTRENPVAVQTTRTFEGNTETDFA